MSSKLLGIGLLSVGCMGAAAAGGYLALRPAQPEAAAQSALVVAESANVAPVAPVAQAEQAAKGDEVPQEIRPEPPATPAPAQRPQVPVTTAKTPPATAARTKPPAPAESSTEEPAAKPATLPDSTPPPAVVPATAEPAVVPPVPAAEPPRYVPDLPVPPVPAIDAARLEQEYEDLTVEKHSVIGIRLDSAVTTRTARVEDRVTATVSRDVTVNGRTAIPSGARLEGTVTLVERGGRFKDRPRLGVRFDRMILADGTRVSISTDTIYREGENPTADSTAKVGAGAVAGAILGAVIGGKKGAAIGTIAGAAGGAAKVMKDEAGETSLPAGAPLTVRLTEDVVVTINR